MLSPTTLKVGSTGIEEYCCLAISMGVVCELQSPGDANGDGLGDG